MIKHFTPSWFSITMGTGIVSILIHNLPYQFHGQQILSQAIFYLNVVLYVCFSIITIARYVVYPNIFFLMMTHPGQISYFFFVHQVHKLQDMNATWLLPIVPNVVTAASGGLLAPHLSYNHGLAILIISYMLMGAGMLVSLSIMIIYFCRLALFKLPPKEVIISSLLPLGPLGQSAYGLLQMGVAFNKIASGNDKLPAGLGTTALNIGIVSSLMLWGCGMWYLVIAILSITTTIVTQKGIPFNMGWWGLTFPIGVYAAATLSIATVLDLQVFAIIGTVISCCLFLIWISVSIRTVMQATTGKLLYAPCLASLD
ncbi:C4-dicarboxylate transporter/malic acid transport protein [Ramicandelaber brevisporus]|nr:C4-dicarboxylate transporter/malic acid transport protein [Ramicandelaber brevisporus]